MTEYQKAQLLHLHTAGEFKYRKANGRKVSRQAWAKMIDALLAGGHIDSNCQVTNSGKAYLDANHMNIKLSVLN